MFVMRVHGLVAALVLVVLGHDAGMRFMGYPRREGDGG